MNDVISITIAMAFHVTNGYHMCVGLKLTWIKTWFSVNILDIVCGNTIALW